ncbi:MAG TPA: GerMN domain-containing protein, partial [Candidatus Pacearchaeota archaeon]|nr:GerMN domain-containing protein [Candidatus Pacearchaeota archaeon]
EPGISIHFAAINQLLNGPTEDESERGIFSMINPGTVVYDLTIEDGVAIVDFNEKLQEGVAGSASVMAIRNQIERTLLQFDDINEVVISINGESEEILQP